MSIIKDSMPPNININTSILNDSGKSDLFVNMVKEIESFYTVIPTLHPNIIKEMTRNTVSILTQMTETMTKKMTPKLQASLQNRLSFVLGCVSEQDFDILSKLLIEMGCKEKDVESIITFISGNKKNGYLSLQKGGVELPDANPIDANPIDANPIDANPIDANPIDANPIPAAATPTDNLIPAAVTPDAVTPAVNQNSPAVVGLNPNTQIVHAQNLQNRSNDFGAMIELGFTPTDIIGIMAQYNRQAEIQNELMAQKNKQAEIQNQTKLIEQTDTERRTAGAALIIGVLGNISATYLFHTHLRASASAAIVSSISKIIGYVGNTAGILETGGTTVFNYIRSYVSSSSPISTSGTSFSQGLFNLLAVDISEASEGAIEIYVLLISILFMFVLGYSFSIMYALTMGRGLNFKVGLTGVEFGANNKKGGKSRRIPKRGRKRKQTRKRLK